MDNITLEFPIEQIIERFREVVKQELASAAGVTTVPNNEPPITTKELCKFLNITEPTAIRLRQRGTIPFFQIGSAIRYDKKEVIESLRRNERNKK